MTGGGGKGAMVGSAGAAEAEIAATEGLVVVEEDPVLPAPILRGGGGGGGGKGNLLLVR